MKTKKTNLSIEEKTKVAQFLLANCIDGVPARGKIIEAATNSGISRKTVSTIWAAASKQIKSGNAVIFSKSVWSTHKDKIEMDVDKMKEIPSKKRTTYRRISGEMKVSKSLVHVWVKRGLIKPHTNAIKPYLTEANKLCRLRFSLSALVHDRILNTIKFKSMHNTIHIDEKWFYITKENERYCLLPGETEPHRTCKSKRFITKLMFMCVVARLRYASNGECLFDGEIGLFPFTTLEAAKRNNKNRAKGTIETKPIDSITKHVIKDCLINKILPEIKRKWPANASKNIQIQQGNAKPHLNDSDTDFRAVARADGLHIELVCQPPNSPDTNINDLGFFRAIQSLQDESCSNNCDDLVKNVINAFESLTHITLNNVFLSLQGCLTDEIMKCKGGNSFKIPHMGKERLLREGNLPENLQVDESIVKECIEYLRQVDEAAGIPFEVEELISDIGY